MLDCMPLSWPFYDGGRVALTINHSVRRCVIFKIRMVGAFFLSDRNSVSTSTPDAIYSNNQMDEMMT